MELKDCDLRFCTFHYKGKCCNKKREECPYAKVMDLCSDVRIIHANPRTDEIVFYSNDELRTDNVIERPRTDEEE